MQWETNTDTNLCVPQSALMTQTGPKSMVYYIIGVSMVIYKLSACCSCKLWVVTVLHSHWLTGWLLSHSTALCANCVLFIANGQWGGGGGEG